MSDLKMTIACDDYDYVGPLRDGSVRPKGIDLNLIAVGCDERHHRMLQYGEYDACEFSMGTYLVARSQGVEDLEAIPFFPRRMFCHRFIFVRADSPIADASELKGKRIGLLGYQNSLALVVKSMLAHQYGVSADDVTWVTMRDERIAMNLPPGIGLVRAPKGQTLEELLLAGEIDAMVSPDLPPSWVAGEGTLRRLFADYENVEREYYRSTGLFPLMHVLVVKREILERDPWAATSLYDAFVLARHQCEALMRQPHRLSLAWSPVEAERAFFGRSPFYQGVRENRHDVERLLAFAQEQGMLSRALRVEELFAKNTIHS